MSKKISCLTPRVSRPCALAALLALGGCFTLTETPFPMAVMSKAPKAPLTLVLRGFEARVTEFVTVNGISTVYVDGGWYGPGSWYGPGYWETVPVSATVAQPRETDIFRDRARSRFEEAGWSVMAQVPDRLVEVKFTGVDEQTFWPRALRAVGTLFFSDRAEMTCRAKLKIYDNRSGKLLFSRDYAETLEESMWSPVLVLGPMSYRQTDYEYMRIRCLYALTDRATADASSYLAGGVR